jgi:hypothetical protein
MRWKTYYRRREIADDAEDRSTMALAAMLDRMSPGWRSRV